MLLPVRFLHTCCLPVVIAVALVGCASASRSSTPSPTPIATLSPTQIATPAALSPLGKPNCQPSSPINVPTNEVEGTSATGQLWGLLMPSNPLPLQSSEDIKIVWRMTGSGPLAITTTGPGGLSPPLLFGPEKHLGSNWGRPGGEWGTGFHFPISGCWQIHFARPDTTGDVWFQVLPSR